MTRRVAAVTGGTGFLGRHVAEALDAAGWQVRLLVRPDRQRLRQGPGSGRVLELVPDGFETVPGDLGDATALSRLVSGASAVVHLAGLVKARDADAFMAVNCGGTANLAATVAARAPQARFVQVSSQAARMGGLSGYAASKRAGEDAVRATLPASHRVIVRPCVIYGPGDVEGAALLRLARRRVVPVLAMPEPVIAMIHVRDAAAAIVACCAGLAAGRLYEISDACLEGHPWREIVRIAAAGFRARQRFVTVPDLALAGAGLAADGWARLTKRPTLFGLGKVHEILQRDWRPDMSLRPPATSWQPRIGLVEGLGETIDWWRNRESELSHWGSVTRRLDSQGLP